MNSQKTVRKTRGPLLIPAHVWRESDLPATEAGTTVIADGAYLGTCLIVPHRRRAGRPLLRGQEEDNAEHRRVRARVEHTFARMKNWKILGDCRQKGDGLHHAQPHSDRVNQQVKPNSGLPGPDLLQHPAGTPRAAWDCRRAAHAAACPRWAGGARACGPRGVRRRAAVGAGRRGSR
ncbi:hypothetical protein GCM10010358_79210 [Streptomyces minutiscleroticus]|uniref:DDE Tnp4 domain-containing protein n=1 Tax=Streptomyces minutiscleroticus TaxID=68238 RepID=A0A918P2B3_9ACTN|nr:hypothetical protein GCM10010358_79210 [Streptomyces minutiscleroticus]